MVKTLAPWHAPASQFGHVTAIDNWGNPITVCTTRTEADARLIAAAPDLLQLLIDIEAHLYTGAALYPGSLIFKEDAPAHDVIVSAIAKATRRDA
jgi:hypothetical protein